MDNSIITQELIDAYCLSLLADERAAGTISKYRHDLTAFARWLDGRTVTKETAAGWKSHLSHCGYAPRTINSMLAALNSFFRFMDWNIKVRFLKVQRQIFRDSARELTKEEYDRLLTAARESGRNASPSSWRPCAPPASACPSFGISPWRRHWRDGPPSPSRARSARSCYPPSCAASW